MTPVSPYALRLPRSHGAQTNAALDRLAGRYAVALRAGSTLVSLVAGPLAGYGDVRAGWLGACLCGLAAWAAFFTWHTLRRRPAPWTVLADAAVIIVILLAQPHIVPVSFVRDGTTWVLMLASTPVFIAQLLLPPYFSLPLAAVVVVAYVVGAPAPTDASFLVIQAVVTCLLMTLLRRGERAARRTIEASVLAEQEAQERKERRADEREQYRRLHDTVLSTLTMVASGALDTGSEIVAAQAGKDLLTLETMAQAPAPHSETSVALDRRLHRAAAAVSPLTVRVSAPALSAPTHIADAITACVGEALRNAAAHSGVSVVSLRGRQEGGVIVVVVSDEGKGFDPDSVPLSRRGVRESIVGRMASIGGAAQVISRLGAGTRVILRWPVG
ncbi:ATP-binding protein [Microbispora sp. NPDC088329]|uniref:sensor histidine kinase n=1 Tax=Microbispora sp. NPDC088329 TaxID=3154869 RepID=UPI003443376B